MEQVLSNHRFAARHWIPEANALVLCICQQGRSSDFGEAVNHRSCRRRFSLLIVAAFSHEHASRTLDFHEPLFHIAFPQCQISLKKQVQLSFIWCNPMLLEARWLSPIKPCGMSQCTASLLQRHWLAEPNQRLPPPLTSSTLREKPALLFLHA